MQRTVLPRPFCPSVCPHRLLATANSFLFLKVHVLMFHRVSLYWNSPADIMKSITAADVATTGLVIPQVWDDVLDSGILR